MRKKSIDEIAAEWVVCEDLGGAPAAAADLDAWLSEDVRHVGAYARALAVYQNAGRVRALGGVMRTVPAARAMGGRRRKVIMALAASFAALAIFAVTVMPRPQRYETSLGEVTRIPLQDGSVLTLNSNSRVSVDFDESARRIRLDRGEALFEVAKDKLRPFIVRAGDSRAVAVGTSFTVRRLGDDTVQVMVREGIVDVAQAAEVPSRVTANKVAIVHPGRGVIVRGLREGNVSDRLAWREGMLSFNGDTLQQAIEEFARYSRIRIVIDDPALKNKRVVGLYSANDPVGFAKAVAVSMNLGIEQKPDVVYLRNVRVE